MSFNKIKEYNVPYKDKADGQIIDPVEWNANFIHIEDISDQNRQIINETFDSLLNDGANNILIDEAVTGTKENLKEVLIKTLNTFNNYYTKNEANAYVGENTNELVENISYSSENGTFTITKKNGDVITIDTIIEKIPASMALKEETDGAVYLVITNHDGSSTKTNVTSLIEDTIINSSSTVNASAVTDGINKKTTYTLEIKPNSVTLNHLTSEAVSKIDSAIESASVATEAKNTTINNAATSTTKASEASQSATDAKTSATNAEASKVAAQAAQAAAEKARDEVKKYVFGEVDVPIFDINDIIFYPEDWVFDDTLGLYKATVNIYETLVTAKSVVDVNLDLRSLILAEDYGLKSVTDSYDGGFYIYSEEAPLENLTGTIIVQDGRDIYSIPDNTLTSLNGEILTVKEG